MGPQIKEKRLGNSGSSLHWLFSLSVCSFSYNGACGSQYSIDELGLARWLRRYGELLTPINSQRLKMLLKMSVRLWYWPSVRSKKTWRTIYSTVKKDKNKTKISQWRLLWHKHINAQKLFRSIDPPLIFWEENFYWITNVWYPHGLSISIDLFRVDWQSFYFSVAWHNYENSVLNCVFSVDLVFKEELNLMLVKLVKVWWVWANRHWFLFQNT